MSLNRRITLAAVAVVLGGTLAACAPNGTTTTPEPAPTSSSAAPVPTPTPTVHVAIEVDLEGDLVAWADIVAVHERGDIPVLWLVPEPGATLTIVGSHVVEGFSVENMETSRNADGDLVLSPALSPFDGSVKAAGGWVGSDYTDVEFEVYAVKS